MLKRSDSLDALRGIAILLMVLSGSVAFGILPAWMYHAQVPPPYHVFKPDLPGITWVDLVFPFFLFTMGAAFPLALKKKTETQPAGQVLWHIVQRYLLLVFFAIFTMHARAWVMADKPGPEDQWLSASGFIMLFLVFTAWKPLLGNKLALFLRVLGFLLAGLFLTVYPFKDGGFNINRSDIIIIVLANMALFGSLIWWATKNKPLWRIAILPFIMAIFLAGKEAGSWNAALFNWSPVPFMYKFYYLKYLFIVLPGTLAGEWLYAHASETRLHADNQPSTKGFPIILLSWALLISNLVYLFERWLLVNLFLSLVLCGVLYIQGRKLGRTAIYLQRFVHAGIYLLLLGLFFEAYEGGIKKDYSTYSYYFVTSGLAFLVLLSFILAEQAGYLKHFFRFLAGNGRNPMIAYTAGNLLLIPLMKLSHTEQWLDAMSSSPVSGFLRGIVFTCIVSLITLACTKKKLFWKT
ncbi:DUF5009 domain-containing protein [Pedobacter sp. BS3]|uniref:DUF5009 domain-containing protein n=1 Tax=Pedobacter sp. BS3 TaxID=2567937 RepID=UPI001659FCEB|nr:DUF5009 domain-containing protein [Pedobacter sp. BS3]